MPTGFAGMGFSLPKYPTRSSTSPELLKAMRKTFGNPGLLDTHPVRDNAVVPY